MQREGPPLEFLTRRLADCPPDFLAEPRIGRAGTVRVAAVISDLLVALGGEPLTPAAAAPYESDNARADRNRLSLVLLSAWVLHDAWFLAQPGLAEAAQKLLAGGLAELAGATPAGLFVADADRREELARECLRQLGLRPAGESVAQAQDRLATLNSAERARVVQAARQAEERARAIRDAMRRRAEEEANAKATRE